MKLIAAGISHKAAPVAAVELIEKAFSDDLADKSVMVIGAGETAERCVQLLVNKGVRSIFVSSRSFDRAIDLASRCGGNAVCFGYCLFEMRDVDVVIVATSSAETLFSREDIENLMRARHDRPLLLIDLSVPQAIARSFRMGTKRENFFHQPAARNPRGHCGRKKHRTANSRTILSSAATSNR